MKLFSVTIWMSVIVGAILVLYLSWVSSPIIGEMRFMPPWIKNWVDSYEFMAIRTAVPLVLLGMLLGIYLNYRKQPLVRWIYSWMLLTILVILAELGQYFRPMRSVDFLDMVWGSVGSALGLGFICIGARMWHWFKNKNKL
ncbi:VanZ family protein [Mariniflexile gromovii]|uniref:VanZ family protein n=1 Tax=Mariniflexile gromovii TaxID=362523 RepID=A0ABS4BT13_9FLAO|nr:VanZ family protein [Mariniflexile gromovii]MBP0903711.1 VanZ family protein [Mariniflexile gromovii]